MPFASRKQNKDYQRDWLRRRREAHFKDKLCAHCGSTENLELDHIDPTQKVSHKMWGWSEERRNVELDKCQVLCKECHDKKTRPARVIAGKALVASGKAGNVNQRYQEFHKSLAKLRATVRATLNGSQE
jgi:5-methylcytosine-specific restriction endonuclease McrA